LSLYGGKALLNSINFGSYVPQGGAAYSNSSFQRALRTTAALIKADVGVEAVAIDRGALWPCYFFLPWFLTASMAAAAAFGSR